MRLALSRSPRSMSKSGTRCLMAMRVPTAAAAAAAAVAAVAVAALAAALRATAAGSQSAVAHTMAVVAGFTAMWLVANELEDSFGADANDIDVLYYHHRFCDQLQHLLAHGWLESDHWVVPQGEWVSPDGNWTNTLKEAKAAKWRKMSSIALPPLKEGTPRHEGAPAETLPKERPPKVVRSASWDTSTSGAQNSMHSMTFHDNPNHSMTQLPPLLAHQPSIL